MSYLPRVLIVEDEPTVRGLLCEMLDHDYECSAVGTAEEGLELLADGGFAVAITDLKLPGMGGEDFLRLALDAKPSLPVIVVTGASGDESRFIEAGAFGYVLKPFRFEEIEEMIGRALDGHARG